MFITNLNENRRNLLDEIFDDIWSNPYRYKLSNSSEYKTDSDEDGMPDYPLSIDELIQDTSNSKNYIFLENYTDFDNYVYYKDFFDYGLVKLILLPVS